MLHVAGNSSDRCGDRCVLFDPIVFVRKNNVLESVKLTLLIPVAMSHAGIPLECWAR